MRLTRLSSLKRRRRVLSNTPYVFGRASLSDFCHPEQVLEAVHTMRVMFLKHGVLAAAGKDTLTQKALQIMQDTGVLHYWEGSRQVAGAFSKPHRADLESHSLAIHDLAAKFFKTQFPDHEHTNSFAALDLEAELSWSQRKTLVHALAVQEGIPKDELWCLDCVSKFWRFFRKKPLQSSRFETDVFKGHSPACEVNLV